MAERKANIELARCLGQLVEAVARAVVAMTTERGLRDKMKLALIIHNATHYRNGRTAVIAIDNPFYCDGYTITNRGQFVFGGPPCVPGGSFEIKAWEELAK